MVVINEAVATTDQARRHLDSTVIPIDDSTTEGGVLVVHSQGDTVRRLQATYYGEVGRFIERFYVTDSVLLLAVRIDEYYDEPMSGHVVRRTVDSVWFQGDTAIAWADEAGPRYGQAPTQVHSHGEEVRKVFLATLGLIPKK
jgi:hypothetical protein